MPNRNLDILWAEMQMPEANPGPDTPNVTVDEITGTSARGTGSDYSHPESKDHVASQFRVLDGEAVVYDSGELDGDAIQHTATGLPGDTSGLVFEIRYKDETGVWSEWGESDPFATGEPDSPAAPTGVAVNNFTDTTAELTWETPTSELVIRVWRREMPEGAFALVAEMGADFEQPYTDAELDPGTEYEWYLTAYNTNTLLESDPSNVVGGTTQGGDRLVRVSWIESEVPTAPRRVRISNIEAEVPSGDRYAALSQIELEVPAAPRGARISVLELEVPIAPRSVRVSWVEGESPVGQRQVRVSWVESEVPTAPRRARISWLESEIPTAPRSVRVSWVETSTGAPLRRALLSDLHIEAPNPPRIVRVSNLSLEVPLGDRYAALSQIELEVPPLGDRYIALSQIELEAGASPRQVRVSFVESEIPIAPRRVRISSVETEVPTAPRRVRISSLETEVPPSGNRYAALSQIELEVPWDRQIQFSWLEVEVPTAPRFVRISWAEVVVQLPQTLEIGLQQKLRDDVPDVSGRVFPIILSRGTRFPAITYTQVSHTEIANHDGVTGQVVARLQVTAWAETYAQARQIARNIRTSLDGFAGPLTSNIHISISLLDGGRDLYNDNVYYHPMDFTIFYTEI